MKTQEDTEYLGYAFARSNIEEELVNEMAKKGLFVNWMVWIIGERRFKSDIQQTLMLFD